MPMTMTKLLAAALVVALLPTPVLAEIGFNWDGNSLKELCGGDAYAKGFCQGYITGTSKLTVSPACFPDGVTLGQITDIMIKYMNDHPEKLHLASGLLVTIALQEAFPCEVTK